jgi:hypothetical protein
MNRVACCQPECSAAELKHAGFSAHEMRLAGLDFSTLKDIGFTPAQLKAAGFLASEFKLAGHELGHLKELGFTAKECKEAHFDFASLQTAGFDAKQLKEAGFSASEFKTNGTMMSLAELKNAGFTAREIMYPGSVSPAPLSRSIGQPQDPRLAIQELIDEKVEKARIFGDSWRSLLGFFLPYGAQNSFWNRLKCSPMLRHFFIHDARFDDDLCHRSLTDESASPKVTVDDVDSAVNNCALICALLLSIPTGVISNLSEDSFVAMMTSQAANTALSGQCQQLDYSNLQNTAFSEDCVSQFKIRFMFLYNNCIMCFYSCLFTLVTAVLYYMCRPSSSYNNASNITLLKAFTLIVRQDIRKEMRSVGTELPEEPFENRILESEVFMKAKFLAENEAEEQMNQV